jgi:protein SCO1/2
MGHFHRLANALGTSLAALCTALVIVGPVQAANLWQLGDEFTDDRGSRIQLGKLAGRMVVVSMEYTECRFVCSINWRKLTEIQDEADRRKLPVQFVILSLDPSNDTPEAWREYRKARGLKRENWHFVTGNRLATDRVVGTLGVRWWLYDGHIMHDLRILRLDEKGRVRSVIDGFDQPVSAFLSD